MSEFISVWKVHLKINYNQILKKNKRVHIVINQNNFFIILKIKRRERDKFFFKVLKS